MSCCECRKVYDEKQKFIHCSDPDCDIFLCEVCMADHFEKHRNKIKKCYKKLDFDLELLLKKVSLHVQFEVVVLEQIKLVEDEQSEQRLRDYPTDEVGTLNRKTEKRLQKFLTYQDTLTSYMDLVEKSIADIRTTDDFGRLMEYKSELERNRKDAYRDLDVAMIQSEIENGSPFERIQNSINAAKLSVRKFDANDEHTVEQILNAVRSDMNMEHMTTSLAVVGRMNAGKSEFINTFRGKRPNDVNAAKVKMIECTKMPTPYEFVNGNHKVILWDCPGYGGTTKPQKEYINVLKELNCDVYLYLYNGAITENDQVVLTGIKNELNTEIFVARTHADEDFRSEFYTETGCEYEEADKLLKETFTDTITKVCRDWHEEEVTANRFLKRIHWDSKVHYISCRLKWVDKFDYQVLFEDICASLPIRKRENILMVSNSHVLHLLEAKKKFLSERISRISYAAAWEQLIPFKNAYQQLVDAEVQYYLKVFDLNENSIKLCGVNECLRKLWTEVDGLKLDVFDFKPAKDEINFKSVAAGLAMYVPFGLGALIAWPVSKSTSEKYLTDQLENIYRISKASFDSAFESLGHKSIYNQKTSNDI